MEQKTGIIYELRANIQGEWHAFYVGQTNNAKRRMTEHRNDAKNADDTSTLVYRNIKEYLNANDIEWDMFEVDEFDETSPGDLEDEHIVRLLMSGARLWNSKKGSPNWLADRQAAADDMTQRGITSYRKYREILTLEEHNRKITEQNISRIEEQQRQQRLQEMKTLEELAREAQREKIKQDMLAAAERARLDRERMEAEAKRKEAQRQEKWLAEAPAREARLRAETERLQREEAEKSKIKQQREAELDQRLAQHAEHTKVKQEAEIIALGLARQRLLKIVAKR